MYVVKSGYNNFRNIENSEIDFCDRVNILYGGNAEGKTSALEGIYLCSTGRSHRTSHENEVIKNGSQFGTTGILFNDGKRNRTLQMCFMRGGKKSCLVSDVPVKKMSDFAGIFKAIIFCPEHLSIIKDGPSARRCFVDQAISRNDREYLICLQNYNMALAQRNIILNDMMYGGNQYTDMLELWTGKLCEYAEIISCKRSRYIELLEEEVKLIFSDMTNGSETPSFSYDGGYTAAELFKKLESNKNREVKLGTTLSGIHKDDIIVKLDGMPSRSYSSQGQQRSLALAMKLGEGELCRKDCGEYPVYLLDDILSELDEKRRNYIISGFSSESTKRQVIITCCDELSFSGGINYKKIKVIGGKYYD